MWDLRRDQNYNRPLAGYRFTVQGSCWLANQGVRHWERGDWWFLKREAFRDGVDGSGGRAGRFKATWHQCRSVGCDGRSVGEWRTVAAVCVCIRGLTTRRSRTAASPIASEPQRRECRRSPAPSIDTAAGWPAARIVALPAVRMVSVRLSCMWTTARRHRRFFTFLYVVGGAFFCFGCGPSLICAASGRPPPSPSHYRPHLSVFHLHFPSSPSIRISPVVTCFDWRRTLPLRAVLDPSSSRPSRPCKPVWYSGVHTAHICCVCDPRLINYWFVWVRVSLSLSFTRCVLPSSLLLPTRVVR